MDEKTWVDFRAVKGAVSLATVLEHYGINWLRKSGGNLVGRCPLHHGKGERSFSANPAKHAFKCWSCNAHGNVLDFVAAMEHCTLREAALKLADRFALSLPGPPQEPAPPTSGADHNARRAAEKAGEPDAPNRPLTFQLKGIDPAHAYLAERGIDKETAEYFGVGFFPGKGSMSGRVVIPIENEAGELVAYAGRSIDNAEPKYRLPAGFKKSQVLFNLPRAMEETSTGAVVLVEGFFDCMKVAQAEHACVALMGCVMSAQQQALISAHFKQVLILLDGDHAGRQAAADIAARLVHHLYVRVVELPDGQQPDLLSSEQLRGLLAGS